jgi:hypothetical protein
MALTYSSPSKTEEDNILITVADLIERLQQYALRFTNASAYCRVNGWNKTAGQISRMVQDFDHRAEMIQYAVEADQREMEEYLAKVSAFEEHIEF